MNRWKYRVIYILLTAVVICLGLLSRKIAGVLPDIANMVLGDALWALMIYLLIRVIFINWSVRMVAFIGITFCFLIEFSQLYHAEWIDMIRRTTLGGLILGYGFIPSDLAAYAIGIGFGFIVDRIYRKVSTTKRESVE